MNIWDSFKYEGEDKRLFTYVSWSTIDDLNIYIVVEGYQYSDDKVAVEPEGDTFYEKYPDYKVVEAIKKFVELIDKGWEAVSVEFRAFDNKASFSFTITKYGVVATFSVDKEYLLEDCGKRLAEIKRIVDYSYDSL